NTLYRVEVSASARHHDDPGYKLRTRRHDADRTGPDADKPLPASACYPGWTGAGHAFVTRHAGFAPAGVGGRNESPPGRRRRTSTLIGLARLSFQKARRGWPRRAPPLTITRAA